MESKNKTVRDIAYDLFIKGCNREFILLKLQKMFPKKSENALNISMTRAAKKCEQMMIERRLLK